jgi:glycosyltransferase involved in cell wall biosynthesis
MGEIWAYLFSYNYEVMTRYAIKHYQQFCNKIILYDNESTDATPQIAKSLGAEVRNYHTDGLDDDLIAKMKSNCWKEARNKNVDWIVVADMDELLYHPNIRMKLEELKSQGVTIIKTSSCHMVSPTLPTEDKPITDLVKTGNRNPPGHHYNKMICFRPDCILETNFDSGAHNPRLEALYPATINIYGGEDQSDMLMLHYKYIGPIDRWTDVVFNMQPRWDVQWKRRGWGTPPKHETRETIATYFPTKFTRVIE